MSVAAGNNPPLSPRELTLARSMDRVFRAQYDESMKLNVVDRLDFNWLATKEWQDRIYHAAYPSVAEEAVIAAKKESRKLGVSMTDYIDRPQVRLALRHETYKFAQAVNHSSADKLKATLIAGTKNGESTAQLTERVKAVFGAIDPATGEPIDLERTQSWRAEMIARTETAQAYTIGTRSLWQETGVVQKAVWKATSNACPFCMDLDGWEVELNEPFYAQGDSMEVRADGQLLSMSFDYRQVDGPPLHPNCRCALIAKLVDVHGREED